MLSRLDSARFSLSSGGGSAALAAPSKAAGSKASCLRTTTISLGDRAALQVPRHSSIALWQKEGSWSLGKKKAARIHQRDATLKGAIPNMWVTGCGMVKFTVATLLPAYVFIELAAKIDIYSLFAFLEAKLLSCLVAALLASMHEQPCQCFFTCFFATSHRSMVLPTSALQEA